MALASLVDVQFVGGNPVQLFGAELLQVRAIANQDTTTSAPIEAYGSLLVPGSTLMAYDGRTYAEAVFARRPEPPVLIATNIATGVIATITHDATDAVMGAPVQPLAASKFDVVQGAPALMTNTPSDLVHVGLGGGLVAYSFHGVPAQLDPVFWDLTPSGTSRGLMAALKGGTLSVATSGNSNTDGTFVIVGVSEGTSGTVRSARYRRYGRIDDPG